MARRRLGFIFQQFNLVGIAFLYVHQCGAGIPGADRLLAWAFGRWPAETRAGGDERRSPGWAVAGYAAQRANTLSGGAATARRHRANALVQQAEVILADEPVASLDPVSARRVMDILRET